MGTHAKSLVVYRLNGKAVAFDADVGIDAEAFADGSNAASLKFIVKADGRTVAETGVLKGKSESVHIHADLAGAQIVELNVGDAGDGITKDHADHGWSYVNVDDFWQNNPYRGKKDPTLAGPERTADGTIVPNSRFPDMKGRPRCAERRQREEHPAILHHGRSARCAESRHPLRPLLERPGRVDVGRVRRCAELAHGLRH